MSEIKTLADELRQRIREQNQFKAPTETTLKEDTALKGKNGSAIPEVTAGQNSVDVPRLLELIKKFHNAGNEKLLIRLDMQTVQWMKQLKLVSGIDMIQLIAFAVDDFIQRNPQMKEHIKQRLLKEFL